MASSTWEGSRDPDVQADPLDAQIPFISSMISKRFSFYKLETEVGIVWKSVSSVPIQSGSMESLSIHGQSDNL